MTADSYFLRCDPAPRELLDLRHGWDFARRSVGRSWLRSSSGGADGERVDLPHCWNTKDTFQEGVEYYRGPGAYRRTFVAPEKASQGVAWLRSEGFYGVGDVWLNGRRIARVDGQYLGFCLPVTPWLLPGRENRLAIRLTNRCSRWVLPGIAEPDFLLHGGLAGRVWLELASPVHLDDESLRVDPLPIGETDARVEATVSVVNAGQAVARVAVVWSLRNADGTELAQRSTETVALAPGARVELAATLNATGIRRWSPDDPQLHLVDAFLLVDGEPCDLARRRVGFREAEFRPDQGFFLNGQRQFLRGCNRHESLPGLGNALPAALHRADALAIRDMGLNFVRLSHYPQSPAFLDACDELGLLVYAELASWKSVRAGLWLRRAVRQFEGMIRRDRHHPCVILWGMGNESRSRKAYVRLRASARRLDPARPVTYAENHLYRARRQGTLGIPDVWGCNYELDHLEAGRDAARLRCVLVSECSNAPHTQRGDLAAERQQLAQLEADLPRVESEPFVAGFALWCFNDYATLRKRRYLRYCGLVDAWREPKLAAAWLRARYGQQPFASLAADWSEDVAVSGATRRVDVFSSGGSVALRVNGRTLRTVEGRGHHVLEVPFEPGRIELLAAPDETAMDGIDSFGAAARLTLEWADPSRTALGLRVVDARGHWVRDWRGEVALATSGAARAYPYRPGHVRVEGGSARIPVGVADPAQPGEWRATAEGLGAATASIPVSS